MRSVVGDEGVELLGRLVVEEDVVGVVGDGKDAGTSTRSDGSAGNIKDGGRERDEPARVDVHGRLLRGVALSETLEDALYGWEVVGGSDMEDSLANRGKEERKRSATLSLGGGFEENARLPLLPPWR